MTKPEYWRWRKENAEEKRLRQTQGNNRKNTGGKGKTFWQPARNLFLSNRGVWKRGSALGNWVHFHTREHAHCRGKNIPQGPIRVEKTSPRGEGWNKKIIIRPEQKRENKHLLCIRGVLPW